MILQDVADRGAATRTQRRSDVPGQLVQIDLRLADDAAQFVEVDLTGRLRYHRLGHQVVGRASEQAVGLQALVGEGVAVGRLGQGGLPGVLAEPLELGAVAPVVVLDERSPDLGDILAPAGHPAVALQDHARLVPVGPRGLAVQSAGRFKVVSALRKATQPGHGRGTGSSPVPSSRQASSR